MYTVKYYLDSQCDSITCLIDDFQIIVYALLG